MPGAGKRGQTANAAQRAATDARRAQVAASKADRASQKRRINEWRAGAYPMSDWSDEEVKRGRVGSDEGEFYGDKPKLTNKEWKQLVQERNKRTMRSLSDMSPLAVGLYKEVAVFGDPATKLRVANAILERNIGKVPERVVQLDEDPYGDMASVVLEEDRSEVKSKRGKRGS